MADVVDFPNSRSTAKQILQEALDEAKDGDIAFVVLISGDDIHALSSQFRNRDLAIKRMVAQECL